VYEKPPFVAQVVFPEYMSKADRVEAIKNGQIRVYDYITKQPPYIIQNWFQVLSTTDKEYVKCLNVGYDSVLTVTNETVIIRNYIEGGIPGYYYLKDEEELKNRGPDALIYLTELSRFSGFKALQPVAPDFEELGTLSPSCMNPELAQQFCQWLQAVRSVNGTAVITQDRAFIQQDSNNMERSFHFKFNLQRPAVVDPFIALMAFKECMKYDYFYIARKSDDKRNTPLVLGRNWAHCTLLVTKGYNTLAY
jgi:hypothetical protein